MKKITEDQFWEQFKPVQNHLESNASFDGCMFETYGDELAYVSKQLKNRTVWTIVEGENDTLYYLSGYRVVNRLGFFITEVPYTEETEVVIDIEMDGVRCGLSEPE